MISVLCRRFLNLLWLLLFLAGCHSVHNVDRVSPSKLGQEGSVVFVRPTEYSVFGTKSLSDYVEVVYEQAQRNEAGLLEVRVGVRNKGGQHFWDVHGPDFPLSAKTTFYDKPVAGEEARSAPVYETNWQRLSLLRGATTDYKVVCPVKTGAYYQVTLSELVK